MSAGDDGSNSRKADTSEFLFFFQTYCCSQKAAGPQMVQAENTRHFSAPKWDYQPPSISFALSKWSGACLAAPCPGRVPCNFPPLRRRQCGGKCPRLQASRGESPGVPGKCPGDGEERPSGPGERPRRKGKSPTGRGECSGGPRKRPHGPGERPPRTGRAPRRLSGPCPGTGALRLKRIPP